MNTEREESKSNTAVVAVVIALGILGALGVAVVLIGGVGFFYISRMRQEVQVAVTDMEQALHVTPEPDLDAPSEFVASAPPTNDEVFAAAKKIVLAKLPNPNDVAWSEPKIEALDGGWYRLSGALTTDGKSFRWACEVTPVERDGQRDWDQQQLRIDE